MLSGALQIAERWRRKLSKQRFLSDFWIISPNTGFDLCRQRMWLETLYIAMPECQTANVFPKATLIQSKSRMSKNAFLAAHFGLIL